MLIRKAYHLRGRFQTCGADWLLVGGFWLLAAGFCSRQLATGSRKLETGRFQPASNSLLHRREVSVAGAKFGALEIRTLQTNLHAPPRAVPAIVRRGVAEAISSGQFSLDLFVHFIDFFDAGRKERQA